MPDLRYENPPVIETLVEFRVKPNNVFDSTNSLLSLASWKTYFPEWQEIMSSSFRFHASHSSPRAFDQLMNDGIRLINAENRHVCIPRKNGFVFSISYNPSIENERYGKWEDFSEPAMYWWTKYKETFGPDSVDRIGIRFINQIPIPSETPSLADYFTIYPNFSALSEEQQMTSCQISSSFKQNEMNPGMNINIYYGGISTENNHIYFLDIDTFRDTLNITMPSNDNDIREILESLRKQKNKAFEVSLTETLKESLR
jgi:uncharacterized protein (TIGR04255 family)